MEILWANLHGGMQITSWLMNWRPSKTSEHLSKMLRHLKAKIYIIGDLYFNSLCTSQGSVKVIIPSSINI